MEKKNYKVAIYIRVARMDDDAMENQETVVRRFAEEQGYSDLALYSDNGYNGLNFNRPAFMQMEKDICAGLINIVIFKDLSRISRNSIDAFNWLEQKRQRGINVKSVHDDVTSLPLCLAEINKAYRSYRRKQKKGV